MSDTRKTLKEYFSTLGSITSNRVDYKLDKDDNENISLNNENDLGVFKDQSGTERKLIDQNEGFLGNYLNYLVKESKNLYYPADNNLLINVGDRGTKIYTEDSATQVELPGNKKTFIDSFKSESDKLGKNYLDNISLGEYFKEVRQVQDMPIDKTGGSTEKSGNNLFKDIEGTSLDQFGNTTSNNARSENDVLNLVEDYLINNNRFGNIEQEITPYAEQPGSEKNYTINDRFGNSTENRKIVEYENLKGLGASLIKKSAGFLEDSEINSENFIGGGILGYGKRIKDGSFEKIDGNDYRAKNTNFYPKDDNDQSLRQGRGDFNNQNSDSFGTTYTDTFNFYGKNKSLVKLHAIIAAKSVLAIYNNLYSEVFESLKEDNEAELKKIATKAIKTQDFSEFYGSANKLLNLRLDSIREKYLAKTAYDYNDCVNRGIEICLGKGDENNFQESTVLKGSPGFWLSVCSNVIKNAERSLSFIDNISEPEIGDEMIRELMYSLESNGAVRFFNAMAIVGDSSLRAYAGNSLDASKQEIRDDSFYDVDNLEDTPGNRVSKSRMKNGKRKNQLSYAQSTVPSVYLLPMNSVRSSVKLDNGTNHPNPMRAHFGSDLVESTYLSTNNDGASGRVPNSVVKELEDRLDAEYVPFYIQDLRTNEIISFHAFLSSLSDTITPNFNSQGGYGRMDQVHVYNSTQRSIACSFTLMATSKEDFDNMWYKINKITTLLYPQWSQGTQVSRGENNRFIQPFSQVIGASPIVRLRIGDVIKSNYSKHNLGRIFGIGNQGTKIQSEGFDLSFGTDIQEILISAIGTAFGSPVQLTESVAAKIGKNLGGLMAASIDTAAGVMTKLLHNGFVNPLAFNPVNNQLNTPENDVDFWLNFPGISNGYNPKTSVLLLKPNVSKGYLFETGEKIRFNRSVTVLVDEKEPKERFGKDGKKFRVRYKCILIDPTLSDKPELFGKTVFCYHEDLHPLPNTIYANTVVLPAISAAATGGASAISLIKDLGNLVSSNNPAIGSASSVSSPIINAFSELFETNENKFLNADNNPFTRSFETTMGRGIAGKLGGITFDWLDQAFQWETDYNARAPMGCKITFNLDVIHDLPPGLDYSGYNRAPLYNVGKIMKDISGDVYNDGGFNAENNYNNARSIKKG